MTERSLEAELLDVYRERDALRALLRQVVEALQAYMDKRGPGRCDAEWNACVAAVREAQ